MKRILVVDDEERMRRIYTMLLTEEGFDVKNATNATEATRILIRENFDLVLLDIRMPGVDGKEMYEVIREYDREMKVIISSVYPVEEQIRAILGASDYHDKAQGMDTLIAKIKKVLEDSAN